MLIGISDALSDSTAHVDKHDRNRCPHHRRKHGVTGNAGCESIEGRLRVAVSLYVSGDTRPIAMRRRVDVVLSCLR